MDASTLPKGTVLPLNQSSLAPPNATKTLLVNLTQPLLPNGQLRWVHISCTRHALLAFFHEASGSILIRSHLLELFRSFLDNCNI